jgi:hypothetical protein
VWVAAPTLKTLISQAEHYVSACDPSHVIPSGIYSEKSDIEAGFLRILRFPLPILIPPTAPYSLSSYHQRCIISILPVSLNNQQKTMAFKKLCDLFEMPDNGHPEISSPKHNLPWSGLCRQVNHIYQQIFSLTSEEFKI